MREEHGMAGVRFWMTWLALVIAALIAWPHRVVVHRVRAGAKLQAIDEDTDLLLCVVPLGLTAILPLLVAPFWLHARPRTFLAVILVFGAVSTALTQWRRRAH